MTSMPLPRAVLPLLAVAWLVGTGALLGAAFMASLNFSGERLTAAEITSVHRLLLAAAVTGSLLPLLGLLLGLWAGRRAAVWVFAVALLIGGVVAVWVGIDLRQYRPPPVPTPGSSVCQEHSGGGTDCPGG